MRSLSSGASSCEQTTKAAHSYTYYNMTVLGRLGMCCCVGVCRWFCIPYGILFVRHASENSKTQLIFQENSPPPQKKERKKNEHGSEKQQSSTFISRKQKKSTRCRIGNICALYHCNKENRHAVSPPPKHKHNEHGSEKQQNSPFFSRKQKKTKM